MITPQLHINELVQVKTDTIEVQYSKNNLSRVDNQLNIQDSSLRVQSMCDLLTTNCSNRIITQKSLLLSMALTGPNGDNETNIGASKSFSYSLYDEEYKEIAVHDLESPIELWIAKDSSVSVEPFKYVDVNNVSQENSMYNGSQLIDGFMVSGIVLSGANLSMHIQLKPENKSVSYLTLVKFGANPNRRDFDMASAFCPHNLVAENNDSFYLGII